MGIQIGGVRLRLAGGVCSLGHAQVGGVRLRLAGGLLTLGHAQVGRVRSRLAGGLLTLGHVHQASRQQRHTVGWLVVVEVLEAPAAHVRLLVHQARGVADHLQEALLLSLAQELKQEVICRGEARQGVGDRDLVPGSVLHQPGGDKGRGDEKRSLEETRGEEMR